MIIAEAGVMTSTNQHDFLPKFLPKCHSAIKIPKVKSVWENAYFSSKRIPPNPPAQAQANVVHQTIGKIAGSARKAPSPR